MEKTDENMVESPEKNKNYFKNALTLAYLGDSVFTLVVRKYLVEHHDYKPNTLNKMANKVVCARFQAVIMQNLKAELTSQETDIVLRARNAHTNNKAKNSTLEEYSLATQFEALVGFWFLSGELEKIDKIFEKYVMENL